MSFMRKISKNPQNFKYLPHFGQFPAEAREAKEAVLYAPGSRGMKIQNDDVKFHCHLFLKFYT